MGQVFPAVPPKLTKNVLSALIPIYEPALVTGAEHPLTATCRLTLTVYRGLDLPPLHTAFGHPRKSIHQWFGCCLPANGSSL